MAVFSFLKIRQYLNFFKNRDSYKTNLPNVGLFKINKESTGNGRTMHWHPSNSSKNVEKIDSFDIFRYFAIQPTLDIFTLHILTI